jgi:hypothetical protein
MHHVADGNHGDEDACDQQHGASGEGSDLMYSSTEMSGVAGTDMSADFSDLYTSGGLKDSLQVQSINRLQFQRILTDSNGPTAGAPPEEGPRIRSPAEAELVSSVRAGRRRRPHRLGGCVAQGGRVAEGSQVRREPSAARGPAVEPAGGHGPLERYSYTPLELLAVLSSIGEGFAAGVREVEDASHWLWPVAGAA